MKESLFSALGDCTDASVLDLYAGTGALGIEAISRGAARVVFVESAQLALEALKKNIATLGIAAEAQVISAGVERALPKLSAVGGFDLVLADPPYAELAKAIRALEAIADAGVINKGATLTIEHASKERPTLRGFDIADVRKYGTPEITIATFV